MRLGVIGAGIQGNAIVDEFVRHSGAVQIGVLDRDRERLRRLASRYPDRRVVADALDASDLGRVVRWMRDYDAVVSAVPYRYNELLARAALLSGTHFTDLGGNNEVVEAELAVDAEARAQGVTLIPDLGLAPGMVALLAADLARSVEGPREVEIRVGGLPVEPEWPLNYRLFFSVSGLINEYVEPCRVIRGGNVVTVPALSELEALEFDHFGTLEAFQTSGGASTLVTTLLGEVDQLDYKTIRYPGHNEQIRLLRDLGFFSQSAVRLGDTAVAPRDLTELLIQQRLSEVVPDVVLVRITVRGTVQGQRVTRVEELVEYADPARGLSAMACCTAIPAAIVTEMLARGEISERGARPQETCVPVPLFRQRLAERGLTVRRY
jgi:lysine 6-dehydrogenase